MLGGDPLAHPEPLVRRVYAYVAYRIGEGPDAEDLTSETFERALRYRRSYDPGKGKPIAWLLGIARHVIDDRAGRSAFESASDPPDAAAPGDVAEATVERLALAEALAGLEARDRDLLALRYGADLTARQIGELFGTRTNAIEVALHRARGRLRVLLEDGDRRRLRDSGGDGRPVRVSGAGRYSG